MGRTYRKVEKLKLKLKPVWKLPTGHKEHDQGCGRHDERPRKQRTRKDAIRKAIEESNE